MSAVNSGKRPEEIGGGQQSTETTKATSSSHADHVLESLGENLSKEKSPGETPHRPIAKKVDAAIPEKLLRAVQANQKLSFDGQGQLVATSRSWVKMIGLGTPGKSKEARDAFGEMIRLIQSSDSPNKRALLHDFLNADWPKSVMESIGPELIHVIFSDEHLSSLSSEESRLLFNDLIHDSSFLPMIDQRAKENKAIAVLTSTLKNTLVEELHYFSTGLGDSFKSLLDTNKKNAALKMMIAIVDQGPISANAFLGRLRQLGLEAQAHELFFKSDWNEYPLTSLHLLLARIPTDTTLNALSLRTDRSDIPWFQAAEKDQIHQINQKRQGLSLTVNRSEEKDRAAKNWERAEQTVRDWASEKPPRDFSVSDICQLHGIVGEGLKNNDGVAGELRGDKKNIVTSFVGNYPKGKEIAKEMEQLDTWLRLELKRCDKGEQNPVVLAAQLYQRLVSIHPFSDGNGRTSRLVVDYVLQRYNLPPCCLDLPLFAVFGSRGTLNISADNVYIAFKEGIENTYAIMGMQPPFVN